MYSRGPLSRSLCDSMVRIASGVRTEALVACLRSTKGLDGGGAWRLTARTSSLTREVSSGQRDAPRSAAALSRRDMTVTSTMSTSRAPALSSTWVSGKVQRSVSAPVSW